MEPAAQGVLVGLENKIDSQTFDLGVLNVERTELRKELRDEKAREQAPFHTIDFRTTEVRELPHKLRTLFEDNQVGGPCEGGGQEPAGRRGREVVLGAAGCCAIPALIPLSPLCRPLAPRSCFASRCAACSTRCAVPSRGWRRRSARRRRRSWTTHTWPSRCGWVASGGLGGVGRGEMRGGRMEYGCEGPPRAEAGECVGCGALWPADKPCLQPHLPCRFVLPPPFQDAGSSPDMAAAMRQQQEEARAAQARVSQLEQQVVALLQQLEADRALATQQAQRAAARQAALEAKLGAALGRAAATRLDAAGGGGGSGWMDEEEEAEYWGRGGTVGRDGSPGGRQRSPAGFQRTYAAGGLGKSQRRGTSGRDRSPGSPPRSPTGRSISHSPGSTIPTLYPSFNMKPRAPRGFTADAPTWHGNTGGAAGAGAAGGAASPHLPNLSPPSPSAVAPGLARPPSAGGGGGMYGAGGLEMLQEGRAGSHTSSHGTATGPGEQVRAINSTAVLTSRQLLPSVSGGSANGGGGGSSSHGGGGGGGSATGMRQPPHTGGGPGILGLAVSGSIRRASSSSMQGGGGGGGGGAVAAVAGGSGGGGGMQVLSSETSGVRPPVSRSASNTSTAAAAAAATAGVAASGGSVAGSRKGSTSGAAAGNAGAAEGGGGDAEEAAAPVAEEVAAA